MEPAYPPEISIVLPSHNRPILLQEAMASLVTQEFTDWEAIVVDDASTPPVTLPVEDERFSIIRHSVSLGGAAAKNAGIRQARGDVLAFLDDDDRYAPEYLSRAIGVLREFPELDVVFMGVTWFGLNGASGQRNYDRAMQRFMEAAGGQARQGVVRFDAGVVKALLKSVPMALQRPVVRRSAMHRIGLYRPNCLLWDCDLAIRAALTAQTALIPDGLYEQRAENQGYSSQSKRRLEHLRSGIEIKDRLWERSRKGEYLEHEASFRHASGEAHFNLAWHLYQEGERWQSLKVLGLSARRQFRSHQLKLLYRLLSPPGPSP